MLALGYDKIDKFVSKEQSAGNDLRWDGWDLVFFYPRLGAVYSRAGKYHNGQWGFETRVSPDNKGKWRLPNKGVRTT